MIEGLITRHPRGRRLGLARSRVLLKMTVPAIIAGRLNPIRTIVEQPLLKCPLACLLARSIDHRVIAGLRP